MRYNQFQQPIGAAVENMTIGAMPDIMQLHGESCMIERLDYARHSEAICECYLQHTQTADWTYLSLEPFDEPQQVRSLLRQWAESSDPYYFVILESHSRQVLGTLALMRIDRHNRSIEMGWVIYSDLLKRSKAATEAQFLLMQYVFDTLQYRRYEWKCDALNQRSRRAATRLGFQYEGTFRNAVVYKGRSRDTAWFSIIAEEWPPLKTAFKQYLAADNFDQQGQQRQRLAAFLAQ
ncbi:GNAT family N-acetyltransferase [Testudinibacter sp. TR-2022]|uniref:GNAT family N-acetyltransferase n=1 Tax=Testudinibacter sp. TR-2022 TaxID=2585029 RepID=UPI00111A2559|nr:GNAT family protein [Testudinibacter sp. TR-2022]TNH03830.1 GNAT family N-acetyltransferase [Pasteurellaceae bacterium Phil31]TNH11581.1 GNAT family N-acetyltransferase [Testudinibacter sp. TR-2022]TNH11773.1 GNAT family N-acetyltransferase [Testudinibacter sp. TR-2022]TNH14928.1 GNAT family N-acetyltransferase [Testudinibacter sp. TR-2022]TNH20377.1 GNAT family N-acetyltransferase [Testudinibacter sp. TR-2022]